MLIFTLIYGILNVVWQRTNMMQFTFCSFSPIFFSPDQSSLGGKIRKPVYFYEAVIKLEVSFLS
jgi:hypothetical protein